MTREHLIVLGLLIVIIVTLIFMSMKNGTYNESFETSTTPPTTTDMASQLESQILNKYKADVSGKSSAELEDLVARMRLRLDKFGLYPDGSSPDLSRYALKSEVLPGAGGRCTVSVADDRDKYISKSDLPDPSPKVDLSKYVLKSSIPPEKVCPPQKEIDYSKYVLKSSLPPPQKCPPCICPKVKVSAGLCQKCPPAPRCPAPEACPQAKCPEVQACPAAPACPAPQACPTNSGKTFYDVKYIKVPTVITKTVTVDQYGNVINQKIQTDAKVPENSSSPSPTESSTSSYATSITSAPTQLSTDAYSYMNISSMLGAATSPSASPVPYTVTPGPSSASSYPDGLGNFAANAASGGQYLSFDPELNSAFKKTGIYGHPPTY
jgi:hypothetical protein